MNCLDIDQPSFELLVKFALLRFQTIGQINLGHYLTLDQVVACQRWAMVMWLAAEEQSDHASRRLARPDPHRLDLLRRRVRAAHRYALLPAIVADRQRRSDAG
jgi:hypothetical protein